MSSPWRRVRAPKVLRRESEMSMQEGKHQGPADFSAGPCELSHRQRVVASLRRASPTQECFDFRRGEFSPCRSSFDVPRVDHS